MPQIKVGTLVRLSTAYCSWLQAESGNPDLFDDLTNAIGIVRFIRVSHQRPSLYPPRATVHWNDPGMFTLEKIRGKDLEIYHGVLSQADREEFGIQ